MPETTRLWGDDEQKPCCLHETSSEIAKRRALGYMFSTSVIFRQGKGRKFCSHSFC